MEFLVLLGMALLALPFVLPLIAWFSARNSKRRIDELERIVERQSFKMAQLSEAVVARRWLRHWPGGPTTGYLRSVITDCQQPRSTGALTSSIQVPRRQRFPPT